MGKVSAHLCAAATQQQGISSAHSSEVYSIIENHENKRNVDYGVLIVITAAIHGHPVGALISSGATNCYTSYSSVFPLGIQTVKGYTFLELGGGQRILSKSKGGISQ